METQHKSVFFLHGTADKELLKSLEFIKHILLVKNMCRQFK